MARAAFDLSSVQRRILIVDDDSQVRDLLVAVLEETGYEVSQVSDGGAAIAHGREHAIDLLITDLVMPEREGIETIRHFTREHPQIPIIAISGMPVYLAAAKAIGAAVALAKPLNFPDLLQAVRELIG